MHSNNWSVYVGRCRGFRIKRIGWQLSRQFDVEIQENPGKSWLQRNLSKKSGKGIIMYQIIFSNFYVSYFLWNNKIYLLSIYLIDKALFMDSDSFC